MDFLQNTKRETTKVNAMVQKELQNWQVDAGKIDPALVQLIQLFINVSKNGKTLRGLLIKLGYELAGGKPNEDIYKISASYEIFHTAILIHDDIIDNSKKRRGVTTIHEALSENGREIAICLGDAGFFLSTKLLTQSNFPDNLVKDALNYFSQIQLATVYGQILDIQKGDPLTISKLKTAKYSVSGPFVLGAMLAGGDKKLISALETFGGNLGVAYQIQDDIFGVFGSSLEMGKSTVSDIKEGKSTLLFSYAMKKSAPAQKEILKRNYGQGKVSKTAQEKIRGIFRSTGALDLAEKEALKYVDLAKRVIPEITKEREYQLILEQLCAFVLERTK